MKTKNYTAARAVLASTLDGHIIADLADLANLRGRLMFINAAPHPYLHRHLSEDPSSSSGDRH